MVLLTAVELLAQVGRVWAPPPDLTVSEFCDAELVVTSGPLSGTRWRTDFAPYQQGILDAFHVPGVDTVVVQSSAQVGKTAIAVGLVGYHIGHDPCPILIVQPTVEPMARDFGRNRLEPVIEASPILRETVSRRRAKDSSNTILQKTFRGGSLSIGGANSAASLAARSIRLLILDEVDRYPPELPGEGSTIEIAIKRTTAYMGQRRILIPSTPTIRGAPIDTWFQRGDQRRFYVPCPDCGHEHPYRWENVTWSDHDPETARLACPACGVEIDNAQRVALLTRGRWVAEHPARTDRRIVSFHLWEAYSPFSSLRDIVASFLVARKAMKAGDRSVMHTWQNTTLGEPVEPDAGEGVEPTSLLLRREMYAAPVPAGACCLTMGVDVQDDRLEALIVAWGPGEESWMVHRAELPGDTSQPEPWAMLDELLDRQFRHEGGEVLTVAATCIDSAGHRTDEVYDYVGKRIQRRVYAIIGRDGQRPIVSSPSRKLTGSKRRKVPLYTIGVDAAKAIIVARLSLTEKGRGYVHLPTADWCDEEFAAQMTSERLVTKFKSGLPVQGWKQIRVRNEALDVAVYALGALRLLNPDLEGMARQLSAEPNPQPPPVVPKQAPWVPKRPGGFLRGRR